MIAVGFDDKTIEKASIFVAINFYYLVLIFIVTFLSSLLQYRNHFVTTAFSTALLNISLIGALLFSKGCEPRIIVLFLSYGVILGGVFQVIIHLIAIKILKIDKLLVGGFKYLKEKGERVKKDLNSFYHSFFPAIIGNSVSQFSAFLDTWLASFLVSGTISYLYYANRILQLPLALFAIATSVAIFPKISRHLNSDNEKEAIKMLKRAFWFLLFLLTFSTIGGILLSKEIIWLLFERGEFARNDTINTSIVLTMYMVGLLPYGLAKIFSLWLYSKHQQKKAAKIAIKSLIVNILFSLLLIFPFGASGLALSSSLAGFFLFYYTIKEFGSDKFLAIIRDKLLLYLILFSTIEIFILLYLKEFIDGYI